jgi:ankyrin repeat protein
MNGDIHRHASQGNCDKIREYYEQDPRLIERKNARGDTPMHCASRAGQAKVIKTLSELGSRSRVVYNSDRMLPIQCVSKENTYEVISAFCDIDSSLLEVKTRASMTLMHHAVLQCNIKYVLALQCLGFEGHFLKHDLTNVIDLTKEMIECEKRSKELYFSRSLLEVAFFTFNNQLSCARQRK